LYIEDLLALNFMVNTFLLYLTARLAGRGQKLSRLLAGGLLASLYSLVIFLPVPQVVFSLASKLTASLIIVAFVFRPRRVIELLRLCGVFLLASFFVGGAVFALHFFGSTPALIRGGVFYLAPPRAGVIFAGVLVTFFLVAGVWHFSEKRRDRSGLGFKLLIQNGGAEVTVPALVDTGNSLRDPFSGRPVCIASYHALAPLLPQPLLFAYEKGEDPLPVLSSLADLHKHRFSAVPYRSLESGGMLVTFRPEHVVLHDTDCCYELPETVFALTGSVLSLDGDVEALLHPDILKKLSEYRKFSKT
jgi:stage II sporulation protein GA (sporulation sigma-E factor processing peptidase)